MRHPLVLPDTKHEPTAEGHRGLAALTGLTVAGAGLGWSLPAPHIHLASSSGWTHTAFWPGRPDGPVRWRWPCARTACGSYAVGQQRSKMAVDRGGAPVGALIAHAPSSLVPRSRPRLSPTAARAAAQPTPPRPADLAWCRSPASPAPGLRPPAMAGPASGCVRRQPGKTHHPGRLPHPQRAGVTAADSGRAAGAAGTFGPGTRSSGTRRPGPPPRWRRPRRRAVGPSRVRTEPWSRLARLPCWPAATRGAGSDLARSGSGHVRPAVVATTTPGRAGAVAHRVRAGRWRRSVRAGRWVPPPPAGSAPPVELGRPTPRRPW